MGIKEGVRFKERGEEKKSTVVSKHIKRHHRCCLQQLYSYHRSNNTINIKITTTTATTTNTKNGGSRSSNVSTQTPPSDSNVGSSTTIPKNKKQKKWRKKYVCFPLLARRPRSLTEHQNVDGISAYSFFDARYVKGTTFRLKRFLNDLRHSLTQNRRNTPFFCTILIVYLDHGVFHPVAFLFFSKSVFRRGLELPN